ncbi:sulfite exporter TauE/SafE family protein [Candidatus Uhrbacteria bacterium]|nr:sulfite exporter TauE/SafE family protein [Candidatus Uhrbacteria bacterium]
MFDAISLIFPAFIAGILTFLAPCTLPLVPAYLGFISGASAKELQDPEKYPGIRRRVFLNGIFYTLGFSAVFVGLGLLFGLGGSAFAKYEVVLTRMGGAFIIFFGLYLIGILEKIPQLRQVLSAEHRMKLPQSLKPGSPTSSFIFGATFAFGWTPCVGPILGSILFLASSTATAFQGGLLLAVFSLGLAIPFLLIALAIGHASTVIHKLTKVLPYISFIGGAFLIFLGVLLLTDSLSIWLSWTYQFFGVFQYERLLDFL